MPPKNWSGYVTYHSHAIDIPQGLFTLPSRKLAIELRKAALESPNTKGSKYASAMRLLTFYINRAGSNLSLKDRNRLERAKVELRKVFGRG
jgi:hypothetical protein